MDTDVVRYVVVDWVSSVVVGSSLEDVVGSDDDDELGDSEGAGANAGTALRGMARCEDGGGPRLSGATDSVADDQADGAVAKEAVPRSAVVYGVAGVWYEE